MIRRDAGASRQAGSAVRIEEIDQSERDIAQVPAENRGAPAARLRGSSGQARFIPECPQGLQPTLTDDLFGRFLNGGEHAGDTSVLPGDGTVGKGEVPLLQIVVPVDQQELIVRPGGAPALEHTIEHGADERPDLSPDILPPDSKRPRVLGLSEHRTVAVVVQHDEVGSPPEQDGEAGPQADIQRGAEAGGPCVHRSERCGRPVGGRHELAHEAAAGEKIRSCLTLDGGRYHANRHAGTLSIAPGIIPGHWSEQTGVRTVG